MLVVLAIIGVAAGAVALGLGNASRGASAESEARRLASRIQLVADDTMVTDRPAAFAADPRGYQFMLWDPRKGVWAAGAGGVFERHQLPRGVTLSTQATARAPVRLGADGAGVAFDARLSSATDSWEVRYDGLNSVASRLHAS